MTGVERRDIMPCVRAACLLHRRLKRQLVPDALLVLRDLSLQIGSSPEGTEGANWLANQKLNHG